MLFLIEYHRQHGRRVTFRVFEESDWQVAQDERLRLEINLNRRHVQHEVVLLQAATEEALRKTHRRYFEDVAQLVEPLPGTV